MKFFSTQRKFVVKACTAWVLAVDRRYYKPQKIKNVAGQATFEKNILLFVFGFAPIGKGFMTSQIKLIVYLINIVHPTLDKELYDEIALAAVGNGISGSLN